MGKEGRESGGKESTSRGSLTLACSAALRRRCRQPRPQRIPAAQSRRAPATLTAPRTRRARAAPVTARRTSLEKPRLPRYYWSAPGRLGSAVDPRWPGLPEGLRPGGGAFRPPCTLLAIPVYLFLGVGLWNFGRDVFSPVENDRFFPVAARAVLKSNSLRICTPHFLFPSFEKKIQKNKNRFQ